MKRISRTLLFVIALVCLLVTFSALSFTAGVLHQAEQARKQRVKELVLEIQSEGSVVPYHIVTWELAEIAK